jgi:hypothetical protein
MIRTSSLYEACGDLIANYPLAVTADGPSGSARSMVLMRHDGGDARFFVLTVDHDDGEACYSLSAWRAPDGGVDIGPGAVPDAVPEEFAEVIKQGVPLPRHGSLCGWDGGGTITALMPFYSEYTPESPVPSWATMPLADIPEAEWPPFADEPLFGPWFWERYQAGNIVFLDGLIAATPGVVFWVDTAAVIGSGCCAVAHDIKGPEGPTLQRGRYVYFQALRAAKPVPSLKALLADPGRIDLAPRFRW